MALTPKLEDEPAFDVTLFHRLISHIEQADNVALFSTSLLDLQRKVDGFLSWCDSSYMSISAQKSKWMIMGLGVTAGQRLCVRGEPIELVSEYKYVGVWFTLMARDIFTQHYHEKASKACRVACASFALDSFMGALPPKEGKMLYMARVDPILTFGCEVVLDIEDALVQKMTDVQHLFLRRLLGLDHARFWPLYLPKLGFCRYVFVGQSSQLGISSISCDSHPHTRPMQPCRSLRRCF